jgi:dynein intermediate chain 2
VNTESRSFSNQGIKHTEGGWPKDVDPTDAEHTIRYRKKIEKDEEYIKQVSELGDVRYKKASRAGRETVHEAL